MVSPKMGVSDAVMIELGPELIASNHIARPLHRKRAGCCGVIAWLVGCSGERSAYVAALELIGVGEECPDQN